MQNEKPWSGRCRSLGGERVEAVRSLYLTKPRKQPTPFLGESDKDTASHPSLASAHPAQGCWVPWSHTGVMETAVPRRQE